MSHHQYNWKAFSKLRNPSIITASTAVKKHSNRQRKGWCVNYRNYLLLFSILPAAAIGSRAPRKALQSHSHCFSCLPFCTIYVHIWSKTQPFNLTSTTCNLCVLLKAELYKRLQMQHYKWESSDGKWAIQI